MPCYHPLRLASASRARLVVACGQCIGCRLERSRQWAMRCVHEASLFDRNCFITLTYDPEHLPADLSLEYRDFQLFLKRLRRRFFSDRIRFFMCGEYGEKNLRPHFHACLFGFDFPDKVLYRRSASGFSLYSSDILARLWGKGFCSIGDVSFESAAYVARYVVKKITGDAAAAHYSDPVTGVMREPEFCSMSLRPGIGADWLRLYWSEVYPSGTVIMRGKECRPPRFYNRRARELGAFREFDGARQDFALEHIADSSPERLAVREVVSKSLLSKSKRSL